MNVFSTQFNYAARLEKVRRLMSQQDIDAVLVFLWTDQYYLSGMYQPGPWYPLNVNLHTETPLLVFKDKDKDPIFFITYMTSGGLREGTWVKDIRVMDKEPYGKLPWHEYWAEAIKEKGLENGTIGLEEESLVLSTFKKIQSTLPGARFVAVDRLFDAARLVKEPEEITIIRESVKVAEAGIRAGMSAAKIGTLESDVLIETEVAIKRGGGLKEIESMIMSGKRTADQRAGATNWKKIEENDLVTIDLGCVVKGYGSDLTRTWVVGKPLPFYTKVCDDLNRVKEIMYKYMKPGITLRQVYDLGASEFKKAGYSPEATSYPKGKAGLGAISVHGIGLGPMHDPPRGYVRDLALEPGITLSFSLKARFEDFIIRYEDDVMIVPNGMESLSGSIPWKL